MALLDGTTYVRVQMIALRVASDYKSSQCSDKKIDPFITRPQSRGPVSPCEAPIIYSRSNKVLVLFPVGTSRKKLVSLEERAPSHILLRNLYHAISLGEIVKHPCCQDARNHSEKMPLFIAEITLFTSSTTWTLRELCFSVFFHSPLSSSSMWRSTFGFSSPEGATPETTAIAHRSVEFQLKPVLMLACVSTAGYRRGMYSFRNRSSLNNWAIESDFSPLRL